jgi:hypothetical protein
MKPFPASIEGWNIAFQAISIILIAGTVLAGAGTIITGRIVSRRQAAELTQARLDIANAHKAAEEAKLAALREQWERENMETLSLPRKLNFFKLKEYGDELRKYAGTKFFVVTLTDTEPTRTGRMIEKLLVEAGWEKEPMVRLSEADEFQIPDGIWIESNGPIVGPPPNPLKPAMEALTSVLTDSGIGANRSFLNPKLPPAQLPENTLRIVIGLKPDLYFDIKKIEREGDRERMRRLAEPQAAPPRTEP